jgi:hypothetical protein
MGPTILQKMGSEANNLILQKGLAAQLIVRLSFIHV